MTSYLPKLRQSPAWIIAFIVLLLHGLVLLNDGLYMDGSRDYHFYTDGRLVSYFNEVGLIFGAVFQVVMRSLPGELVGFRVMSVITSLTLTLIIFRLSQRFLTRLESAFVALLFAAYPVFEYYPQENTQYYIFSHALFMIAAYISVRGLRNNTPDQPSTESGDEGSLSPFYRIMRDILLYISFGTASLLTYHGGLVIFLFFYTYRGEPLIPAVRGFVWRELDLFILPVFYWITKAMFFPNPPTYNAIVTSWRVHARGVIGSLEVASLGLIKDTWEFFVMVPWLALLAILFLQFLYPSLRDSWREQRASRRAYVLIMLFSGVIFVLGIYTYAAVDKPLTDDPTMSDKGLLLGLPTALFIFAGLRLLPPSRLSFTIAGLCIVLFGGQVIQNYFSWQAHWVKDRSFIYNMRQHDELQAFSTFWIYDDYPRNYLNDLTWPNIQHKVRLVWWSPYQGFWQSPKNPAPDANFGEAPDHSIIMLNYIPDKYWLFRSWEFWPGCHTLIRVEQGERDTNPLTLSLDYYRYRFFEPDRMDGFLSELTKLQTIPIPAPEGADCPTQFSPETPVYNPAGDSAAFADWLGTVLPNQGADLPAEVELVLNNMTYDFMLEDPDQLARWKDTLLPEDLIGMNYLFVDDVWLNAEPGRDKIFEQYMLLQEWENNFQGNRIYLLEKRS